jgi:beta-glucosidase
MQNIFLTLCSFVICMFASAQPYKDPSLSVEKRVADLMGRMTLDEKIAQLGMIDAELYKTDPNGFGVCECPKIGVEDVLKSSYETKKYARENTRLGIPPIMSAECLHGLLAYGATIFPQALAQGSTWNPGLIEQMARMIAEESSATGVDQALSPLFDLAREPRYGRMEECYSEDAFLTGEMGAAFVRGMQGDPAETRYRLSDNKVICTAKHFVGYSSPIAGINVAPAAIGLRELRSLHLPPFEKAVKDANVYSVMPSYNEIDGIPAHANNFLLNHVLRDEWGFQGYVFADYSAVWRLFALHKVAENVADAGKRAIMAGVDLEASRAYAFTHLKSLVEQNKLDVKYINQACKRILTVKFKAGLFDKPYPDISRLKEKVHIKPHIEMAQRIAEESVILLKNDKDLLPLDLNKIKSLAVIGPNADQVQYGDYSWTRDNSSGTTILQGIRNLSGNKLKINYAKGCTTSDYKKNGFAEAVRAAEKSDAVVLVLGETSVILSGIGWGKGPGESENQEPFTCGENYDVSDLNPHGVQRELAQAIVATGKPVILVLVHGRSWSINWEKEHIPAILEAWYPGECGGDAMANILFGRVNPSGRLTVTIPQSVGHVPVYYDHKPSGKGDSRHPGSPDKPGRNYVFSSPDPLFPFGFGLSYTTFEYSNMRVSKELFGINDVLTVSTEVKNTGKFEGREVVQLYVNDEFSSTTTPVMALKKFKKVLLKPEESQNVSFSIKPQDLGLWNEEMKFVTESGKFKLMFARSAEDVVLSTTVTYK